MRFFMSFVRIVSSLVVLTLVWAVLFGDGALRLHFLTPAYAAPVAGHHPYHLSNAIVYVSDGELLFLRLFTWACRSCWCCWACGPSRSSAANPPYAASQRSRSTNSHTARARRRGRGPKGGCGLGHLGLRWRYRAHAAETRDPAFTSHDRFHTFPSVRHTCPRALSRHRALRYRPHAGGPAPHLL
ncbi:MAG: hypothetical protein WDN06_00055 [Asticcacaulis sp.]